MRKSLKTLRIKRWRHKSWFIKNNNITISLGLCTVLVAAVFFICNRCFGSGFIESGSGFGILGRIPIRIQSGSKIAIYLSLDLHKRRQRYKRSLQQSKENIQHFNTWNFFSWIRIWILNPDPLTWLNLDPIRIRNSVWNGVTPKRSRTQHNRQKNSTLLNVAGQDLGNSSKLRKNFQKPQRHIISNKLSQNVTLRLKKLDIDCLTFPFCYFSVMKQFT